LLKNLSDSVQKLIARHPAALRQAGHTATPSAELAVLPPARLPTPPQKYRAHAQTTHRQLPADSATGHV
jgi:hypothetical protein